MEEAAEEMMGEFLLKMRQAHPGIVPIQKAKALLVVGTPVTRIVEVAEKRQVGMIILGSHGRTGLAHLLIGSKVQRVVQLSSVPVTVVKTPQGKVNFCHPI
jgi:nucleotide-binding universal stress UspA family protein